jgi:hypothetical protein
MCSADKGRYYVAETRPSDSALGAADVRVFAHDLGIAVNCKA